MSYRHIEISALPQQGCGVPHRIQIDRNRTMFLPGVIRKICRSPPPPGVGSEIIPEVNRFSCVKTDASVAFITYRRERTIDFFWNYPEIRIDGLIFRNPVTSEPGGYFAPDFIPSLRGVIHFVMLLVEHFVTFQRYRQRIAFYCRLPEIGRGILITGPNTVFLQPWPRYTFD